MVIWSLRHRYPCLRTHQVTLSKEGTSGEVGLEAGALVLSDQVRCCCWCCTGADDFFVVRRNRAGLWPRPTTFRTCTIGEKPKERRAPNGTRLGSAVPQVQIDRPKK